jgi:hypothetical protein
MSRRFPVWPFSCSLRLTGELLLGFALWQVVSAAQAQVVVARPYWGVIDEELSYAVACRTLAEARKIHAEAYSIELDNWKKYVDVYWDRRRRWEAEYRERHPDEWKVEKKRQERMKELVNDQYQRVLNNDTTRVCNWILRELANSVASFQYISGKNSAPRDIDIKLTEDDLKHIRLTDGSGKANFAANQDSPLSGEWPILFQAPGFERARKSYEAAVNEVLSAGKLTYDSHTKLMEAIDGLYAALNVAYPEDTRKVWKVYEEYQGLKDVVGARAGNLHMATIRNDASLITGSLSFKGDSLFGLLQHMYRHGLKFASPNPGDKEAYDRLFVNLRQMYVLIGQEQPGAGVQQGKADGAKK